MLSAAKNQPMSIRSVTHMEAVRALAHRIWPQAYAGILTKEQIENMLSKIYSLENLRAEMEAGHRFWLAADADLAAFASAYTDGQTLWIKKLYVLPTRQGQGIGTSLIRTIVAAFPQASELKLLVNDKNTPAQSFYEKLGFTKAGTTPVTMGDFEFCDLIFSAPAANFRQ